MDQKTVPGKAGKDVAKRTSGSARIQLFALVFVSDGLRLTRAHF